MNSVHFIDSSTGWAVGRNGTILKTTNGGSTFVENMIGEITLDYLLSQNYPNPFNPSTIIKYAVSSRQFVSLKVYDVLGKEIVTLVNKEKPAGNYEVEFNSRGLINQTLPSGIYFYLLRAGNYIETKKMVLLK